MRAGIVIEGTEAEIAKKLDELIEKDLQLPHISYCPHCGSKLAKPQEDDGWTDCPKCGFVCIEFYRKND